ncbi:MAG: hypothetical protein ACD_2C00027G0007 [uncultured bacterium (gcode 4)]|uniref:Uncharacterized protein n=1 Tax=uncultured bacterium (gcode 4) TaxID=1234023 RepID=K2GID8_9BACT|nr:MAG: hypothetical protein ACD_2C00027G0007 [uncultured bacterium (gcode 4)]
MEKQTIDDITRLLSMEMGQLNEELWHTPEEARAIVNWVIDSSRPTLANLIVEVSDDVENTLNPSVYSVSELQNIISGLLKILNSDKSEWVNDILVNNDLFYVDQAGNNILIILVSEWNIDAVEYLTRYPFDFFHKNKNGYNLFDLVEILSSDNQLNESYKNNVRQCYKLIYDIVESALSIEFVLMTLKNSSNFHQYEELYEKILISSNINEINWFGTNLLQKASLFWDVKVAKVLVNNWIDVRHVNWKWETAKSIAELILQWSRFIEDYEEIIKIISDAENISFNVKPILDYFADNNNKNRWTYSHFMHLLKKTWNIDEIDPVSWNTLLHVAISAWDLPLINVLLKNNADIWVKNNDWLSAEDIIVSKWHPFFYKFNEMLKDNNRSKILNPVNIRPKHLITM